MPEMDIRRSNSQIPKRKKKKKKKKESLPVAIAAGLFPWKGDKTSDVVRKLVFLVSLCALVFATVKIFDFYFAPHEETAYSEYWEVDNDCDLSSVIKVRSDTVSGDNDGEEVEVEILEKYREFWETNPEFVGYLSIDPYINYPVPQAGSDKPEDFYLHHNYYGRKTENGTIYADSAGKFTYDSRPHNIVLHGHNLITKNNFQPLLYYRNGVGGVGDGFAFLKENPIIKFDTLYEAGTYKIFSVFQINVDDIYGEFYDYWRKHYFHTRDSFYEYVTEVLDRSQYYTGVDLRYGDELITLSTCDFSILSDIRLVIVARRVRLGETSDMDLDLFVNNRSNNGRTSDGYMKYKMFDAYYKTFNHNRGWAGRQWELDWVEGYSE